MRSRKEQLQAYQFLRRRIGAALLSGEPDTLDPPMRRVIRTSFAGLMVAILIVAVFGIYGLVRPGGAQGWKQADGALIVEKETGSAYVYFQGELNPMLNYASARLYLNQAEMDPRRVSRGSLEGTPRAGMRGIPGAPHSLPDPRGLIVEPWTVCADPVDPSRATVTLIAGEPPDGGDLAPNEALVVTANDTQYLIWRNARYRVPDPRILSPFGLNQAPQEVGASWVNALPEGPEIVYPTIPQLGAPGPQLPSGAATRVGELYVVNYGNRQQFVLVMPTGFAQIPAFAAQVIQSDPEMAALDVRTPGTMVPSTYSQVQQVPPPSDLDRYPSGISEAANADVARRGVLCVSLTSASEGELERTVSAVAEVPGRGKPVTTPAGSTSPTADRFAIEAGRGAIVVAQPHPNMASNVEPNATFLITDRGVRYPIANDEALGALGYGEAEVARLPTGFLEMLPSGPTLSQDAASQPASVQQVPQGGPQPQTPQQP